MARKIRNAKEMLDEIATTKSKFNLLEGRPIKNMIRGERGTYSFVKISNVIGREEDRGNVVKFLMNPTDGEDILVLPIAGIDGIEKNVLAQLVFNDETVERHFELRIWVCVGEDFDGKRLMIKILKSVTGRRCSVHRHE
ncbi:hypothetical protein V6N11_065643 [Hibiscus sabdariffa]|uniref:NB-ARC domain-containing protein n=1 Tax=Hibiscus sabdariffa TaxID=183260 RepID=A0ABR2PHX5_9ROSI